MEDKAQNKGLSTGAQTEQRVCLGLAQPQQVLPKTGTIIRLIFIGVLLPTLDLATDLITIYQHWTSSQWVLNYLAISLIISLVGHNMISAWYYWRHWGKMAPHEGHRRPKSALLWSMVRIVSFGIGGGDILLALELISQLSSPKLINDG